MSGGTSATTCGRSSDFSGGLVACKFSLLSVRTGFSFALLVVALSTSLAAAQPGVEFADSLGADLVDGGPGAAVIGLLGDDGSRVRTYGAVDSTGAPPTARSIFEIGSATKTFTGLLLAERVERGVLAGSDPVRALLPDSVTLSGPRPARTLEHLVTHRSGLPRLPSNMDVRAVPRDPYSTYCDHDLMAFLDEHSLSRAAGDRFAYSNLGMGLLGFLLARRADTTYAALVRQRIAAPLGLSDTRVHLTTEQRSRLVQGYDRSGRPASPWHFGPLAGAGALRSTATDMLSYLQAHRAALATPPSESVLHRAMRRAVSPRATAGTPDTQIGMAWHVTERKGTRMVWHNGATGGFRSFVGFDRATGRGVVVLVSASVSPQTVTRDGFALLEHLAIR